MVNQRVCLIQLHFCHFWVYIINGIIMYDDNVVNKIIEGEVSPLALETRS